MTLLIFGQSILFDIGLFDILRSLYNFLCPTNFIFLVDIKFQWKLLPVAAAAGGGGRSAKTDTIK